MINSSSETRWTTTGQRVAYRGRTTLVLRDVVLPDGSTIQFEVDQSIPFAVAALILDRDEVLLSRQYRYPIDQWIFDLPAGAGEEGESPVVAVTREVEEELGLRPRDLVPLHSFFANPGRSSWPIHVFFGRATDAGDPKVDDPTEQVRLVRMPLAELDDRIAAGEIVDPTLLIARAMAGARGFLTAIGG